MKRYIESVSRDQGTLFPDHLEDWINDENVVRVIDAFVDELDLVDLGFDLAEATGRPGYHPSILLKLYIYGYLNRVQSSRRLEREALRNVEVMWLLGRLAPDHKTIADFRKDNGQAIRKVCAQFVELCRQIGLLSVASVAIDGSKFKAVNNRDRNFTKAKMQRRKDQIAKSVTRYLDQLDSTDRQEPSPAMDARKTRLSEKITKLREEMLRLKTLEKQMEASSDQQVSLTDLDSRSMATSGRGSGVVGYNVQTAVDTEHHLIVAHDVTNKGSDRSQLAAMAKKTKEVLNVDKLDVVADRGYFKSTEILACDQAGITVTLPKPSTSTAKAEGRFGKQDFRYVADEDGLNTRRYWTDLCGRCSMKAQCTPSKERRVSRWEHEDVLERVQQRLDEKPQAMRQRRETVEHPFGTIKMRMGATHFLMKRLKNVSTEMALSVLTYNLTRVVNILGITPLIQAIRA